MSIQIISVSPTEIAELQALARQSFYESFKAQNTPADMAQYLEQHMSVGQFTQELSNPDSSFYFALDQGNKAGYLKLNFGAAQTDLQEVDSLEIERIYLLADYQGKGIGQQMIAKAIHIAQDKGLTSIWLGVWEKNYKAIRFYEKMGFSAFGKHKFILGTDLQWDILMRLELE